MVKFHPYKVGDRLKLKEKWSGSNSMFANKIWTVVELVGDASGICKDEKGYKYPSPLTLSDYWDLIEEDFSQILASKDKSKLFDYLKGQMHD